MAFLLLHILRLCAGTSARGLRRALTVQCASHVCFVTKIALPSMNWTENVLYRASRRTIRKANPKAQRQKENIANFRLRIAEGRDAAARGEHPPISYLQPGPSSPRLIRQSQHRDDSPGQPFLRGSESRHVDRVIQQHVPSGSDERASLPTISRFFAERGVKDGQAPTAEQVHINNEELALLKQRLLAQKDWGTSTTLNPDLPARQSRYFSVTEMTKKDVEPNRVSEDHSRVFREKLRRKERERKLRREDIRIRIGSQEKRLWESSTVQRSNFGVSEEVGSSRGSDQSPSTSYRSSMCSSCCFQYHVLTRKRCRQLEAVCFSS